MSGVYTNPSGSFDSSLVDAALGPEVETDHDRPPLGSFTFGPAYDGTVFVIKDNRLYYSKPKQPEYFPELNYLEVSPPQFPGKTGVFSNSQPYYLTANEIYYIQGTGSSSFFPLPMKAKTGAQSIRGAVSVDGKGIFHTGQDGIYLFANGTDRKISEDALEPIFRGEDAHGLPGVSSMSTSWLLAAKNNLYFGYQSSGYSYPTNVIVMNIETGRFAYFIYNDGSAVQIRTITHDETNNRILVGDNSGYVRVIESPTYTDDSGTDISFEVQSKDYMLQTRAHFPRWIKYDVDASDATSVTGVLLLDDATHHSHTISGSRNTRRRLVDTGNGKRAAIRISGSGPATIYAAELE